MERTLDKLPLRIQKAAVDFVPRPIASLTLGVAVCRMFTSSAILHRGCTSEVAAIACARHVLRLDKHLTAERRCNLVMQHHAISSGVFIGGYTFDFSKFSIVRRIAESMKTHEVVQLESDHCNAVELWSQHKSANNGGASDPCTSPFLRLGLPRCLRGCVTTPHLLFLPPTVQSGRGVEKGGGG